MSTIFHTPIATGESNSPDTINTRLSGLDSAIAAVDDALGDLVIDSGTSDAETIAARTGINYKAGTPPASLSVAIGYAAADTYNILAYGAVSGGSAASNTTAIQAAISAASAAGGGVVFVPEGTYKFTILTMSSYVTLRGVGPKSILDWEGTLDTHAIDMGTSVDAIVERLQIQNLSAITASHAINSSDNSARLLVRDVTVIGKVNSSVISSVSGDGSTVTVVTTGAHGLTTGNLVSLFNAGAYSWQYFNITVVNSTTFTAPSTTSSGTVNTGTVRQTQWTGGIVLGGDDGIVERCILTAGFYAAIRIANTSTRCQAIHNRISDVYRGIMVDGGATYNHISHNVVRSAQHLFAKLEDGGAYNTLAHNIAIDCSNGVTEVTGTLVVEADYSMVDSNHLLFSGTVLSAAAIYVHTNAARSRILNNTIKDHSAVSILLRTGASNMEISGNKISGGVTGIRWGQGNSVNIMIVANNIDTVSGSAIETPGGSATASNFVVMNNVLSNCGSYGIILTGNNHYGVISGNIIQACGLAGIRFSTSTVPCTYIAVTGNAIYDVDNAGNATQENKAHIGGTGGQDHVSIVGNVCNDTAAGADSIRMTSMTNGIVVGNATSAGVSSVGAGTTVANNV